MPALYEHLTVEQSVAYFAAAHEINEDRVDEVLAQVNLLDKRYETIKSLSRGMRQRVGIAQAIIHHPKYLILDEPASGLDPEARIHLAALFKELCKEGITLLVSSHILAELDQYANNLIVLKEGQLVETDFSISENTEASIPYFIQADNAAIVANIASNAPFTLLECKEDMATFSIPENTAPHIALQFLLENGVHITAFGKHSINIQDAYLKTIKNA
jgi:ABC-2 type transport system ATP-binding protein